MDEQFELSVADQCSRIQKRKRDYERVARMRVVVVADQVVSREQILDATREFGLMVPEGQSINAFTLEPSRTMLDVATKAIDTTAKEIGKDLIKNAVELLGSTLDFIQASIRESEGDDYVAAYDRIRQHLAATVNEMPPTAELQADAVARFQAESKAYTALTDMLVEGQILPDLLARIDAVTLAMIGRLEEGVKQMTEVFKGGPARADYWENWVRDSTLPYLQQVLANSSFSRQSVCVTSSQAALKLIENAVRERDETPLALLTPVTYLADQVVNRGSVFAVPFPLGQYGIAPLSTRFVKLTDELNELKETLIDTDQLPEAWTNSCTVELTDRLVGLSQMFLSYYAVVKRVHDAKCAFLRLLESTLNHVSPAPVRPTLQSSTEAMFTRAAQQLRKAKSVELY